MKIGTSVQMQSVSSGEARCPWRKCTLRKQHDKIPVPVRFAQHGASLTCQISMDPPSCSMSATSCRPFPTQTQDIFIEVWATAAPKQLEPKQDVQKKENDHRRKRNRSHHRSKRFPKVLIVTVQRHCIVHWLLQHLLVPVLHIKIFCSTDMGNKQRVSQVRLNAVFWQSHDITYHKKQTFVQVPKVTKFGFEWFIFWLVFPSGGDPPLLHRDRNAEQSSMSLASSFRAKYGLRTPDRVAVTGWDKDVCVVVALECKYGTGSTTLGGQLKCVTLS